MTAPINQAGKIEITKDLIKMVLDILGQPFQNLSQGATSTLLQKLSEGSSLEEIIQSVLVSLEKDATDLIIYKEAVSTILGAYIFRPNEGTSQEGSNILTMSKSQPQDFVATEILKAIRQNNKKYLDYSNSKIATEKPTSHVPNATKTISLPPTS